MPCWSCFVFCCWNAQIARGQVKLFIIPWCEMFGVVVHPPVCPESSVLSFTGRYLVTPGVLNKALVCFDMVSTFGMMVVLTLILVGAGCNQRRDQEQRPQAATEQEDPVPSTARKKRPGKAGASTSQWRVWHGSTTINGPAFSMQFLLTCGASRQDLCMSYTQYAFVVAARAVAGMNGMRHCYGAAELTALQGRGHRDI